MLVEELKRCIKTDVKSFSDEKEVEPLEKAARDDYTLLTRYLLFTRQILENHFNHLLVRNQVLVSSLVILIRMLPTQTSR